MALKFQYNKIALQNLNKQLDIRLRTLPTLKSKEAALRYEVEKTRKIIRELSEKLEHAIADHTRAAAIWGEFQPDLVSVGKVLTRTQTIAGLKTPELNQVIFNVREFSLFGKPKWFPEGIKVVQELTSLAIERDFFVRKMELLNHARRKTTQKVNLYEKIQIPAFEDAIRKIRRFMEDEENLSKSAQKIIKRRKELQPDIQA